MKPHQSAGRDSPRKSGEEDESIRPTDDVDYEGRPGWVDQWFER